MDEFWVGFLVFMFYVPIVFLWFFGFYDLIRRRDLDAWSKALWAILFFPLLGVLFYFILRPRDANAWASVSRDQHQPNRSLIGQTDQSEKGDLDALTRLHANGTLSDDELDLLKHRVLASSTSASWS
jgi:Phospholipase_D-nuclease N-terminal